MTLAGSIRGLLRLARSEQGMALPTALFATVASLALGGAAVMSSVDVQQGSKRDGGSKSAIAAADAGANVALLRLNRYGDSLDDEKPCLVLDGSGQLEPGDDETGWCPAIEGDVGGATYSYRVSSVGGVCGGHDVCVVSTGTAGEVSRRIELSLDESSLEMSSSQQWIEEELQRITEGKDLSTKELKELEEQLKKAVEEKSSSGGIAGLIGREEIIFSGNADIRVGIGTNGNLVTTGNATICEDIQVGIGKKWTKSGNAEQCPGYSFTEGTLSLPAVSSFIPSDIATNNSNYRLVKCTKTSPTKVPTGCQSDTYSGGSWTSTSPWNPSTRALSASGNTTLTVGGGDYWLCSISLSGNSQLIMAEGANVRFFFDTPQNCGTSNQISMSGNNRITATGYGTGGQFDVPGFYLLGSATSTSQISLSGNSSTTNEFVIYGPDTYVSISGNATYKGIIAGRKITMSGNGKVMQDGGFEVPPTLDPSAGLDEVIKGLEETITSKQEEISKFEEEFKSFESQSSTEYGSRSFSAQAYVECTGGTVPSGAAPNSSC